MAQLSFRDRFFTRPVARAITSPFGIMLAGAGAAVGIVVAGPVLGVALGIGAWATRVFLAVPKGSSNRQLDPFALRDPWRNFVIGAQSDGQRFQRTVKAMKPGPLQDRLREVSARLDEGLNDCWQIAQRGHEIDGALHELDPTAVYHKLERAQQLPEGPTKQRTVAAVEAQYASIQRLFAVSEDVKSRLQLLDARRDELIARSVELSVTGSSDLTSLDSEVDSMVHELEAIRQAMDETRQAASGDIDIPELNATQTQLPQGRPSN